MNNNLTKNIAYWKVIRENTGYDFSGYSEFSLNNRLEKFISLECIGSPAELKEKLFYEGSTQKRILGKLLINYTEMFRDPDFFLSIRNKVLPHLSLYPKIRIWHAGCASGEEVYSLAILLDELKLLDRCEIFATDINQNNINNAASGIFPLQRMQESSARYFRSGGNKNLSEYYTAFYDNVIFHNRLRKKINFINHDILKDQPLKGLHLILCRNVFIYFNYQFQQKVLKNINDNLCNYGYFGMGLNEQFVDVKKMNFTNIDSDNMIYRKIYEL